MLIALLVWSVATFAAIGAGNQSGNAMQRPASWATPIQLNGVPNLHKVSEDLYRSAQPTAEGMKNLKMMGVETVVNLRSFHSDRGQIGETALAYEHIYMKAWHPEEEEIVRFLQIVTNPKRTPVLVHCLQGADRTGTMSAIYRIAVQGWTKDKAIKEMTEGGFGFHGVFENLLSWIKKLDIEQIKDQAGIRSDQSSYKNTFDYIEKTCRLWGIAAVSLNEDNSITLEDEKTSGYGYGLMMFDFNHKVVDAATIRRGQSCSLADGRHVLIEYELKKVEDGKLTFVITEKFDAGSFGGGVKEEKKTMTLSPYKLISPQQGAGHPHISSPLMGRIKVGVKDSSVFPLPLLPSHQGRRIREVAIHPRPKRQGILACFRKNGDDQTQDIRR
jgi:protein tyrosine phosphatase (PTP) superfamily phosphohydrolase (DUF442 family)